MIQLAYHFKCDVTGCPSESKENIGALTHTMSIPQLPLPRGWHYLDHRIICQGHAVVVDKAWVDAPPPIAAPVSIIPAPPNTPGPIRSPIK